MRTRLVNTFTLLVQLSMGSSYHGRLTYSTVIFRPKSSIRGTGSTIGTGRSIKRTPIITRDRATGSTLIRYTSLVPDSVSLES